MAVRERDEILKALPHRAPFLFVDRLIEVSDELIVGEKTFGPDEFFFKGHFPDFPIVPGVILVETMAQMGGAGTYFLQEKTEESPIFFLATVNKARFVRPVRPGDTVTGKIRNVRISSSSVMQEGELFVDGEKAAQAQFMSVAKKE